MRTSAERDLLIGIGCIGRSSNGKCGRGLAWWVWSRDSVEVVGLRLGGDRLGRDVRIDPRL